MVWRPKALVDPLGRIGILSVACWKFCWSTRQERLDISVHAGVQSCLRCYWTSYATFRSTVQQSDAGCPKQELSGGELRQHFISKTRIKRRNWRLSAVREALADNSVDHPVFYQDEVDIHLNPKIGADWGHRGKQRKVATPGQNKKHYLAGALHGQTGQIVYVGGERKTSDLFIELLEKLKGQYRRAKSIRLIVDNYIIHKSKKTQKWLSDNPKFKLLFLPVYSPWHNKIKNCGMHCTKR